MSEGMHANRRNRGPSDNPITPDEGCYIWEGMEDREECPVCGHPIDKPFKRQHINCPIPYCLADYTKGQKLSTPARRLAARNSQPETQEP